MMAEFVCLLCSKGWKKRQFWLENNIWIISLGQNILIKSMNIRQGASLLEHLHSSMDLWNRVGAVEAEKFQSAGNMAGGMAKW